LSDSELANLLAERGFCVARRTVAKYRAMEGILPANLRTGPKVLPGPKVGRASMPADAAASLKIGEQGCSPYNEPLSGGRKFSAQGAL
jgi:hypothetical protein